MIYYRKGRVPQPGIVILGNVTGDVSIFDRPGPITVRVHNNRSGSRSIRAVFEQQGELSAAIELPRLFPGVTDNVQARECAPRHCGMEAVTASTAQAASRSARRQP